MSGPRYSIFPADALHDERMRDVHVRVLALLGTHTDNNGWCTVNQRKLGEQCGRTRETVNRAIADLCEWGYLTKQDQRTKANGRTISMYQIVMDRPAKAQPVDPPVILDAQPPVTSEDHNPCDAIASQHNDPSSNEEPPNPPDGGLRFASLWEVWPADDRGNRDNAEGAWGKLSDASKRMAIDYAETAVGAVRRRKGRIPALVRYIRERMFEEFDGAPPVDVDGRFEIKPGMPEWGPWLGWIREKHGKRGVDSIVKIGVFRTETRWPDGSRRAA